MKKALLFSIFLLISFSSISQNEKLAKAFDSIFYQIAVNVSSADPSKAMHLADSLYTYSSNNKQRLKSLMLKADILEKQEKRGEAIQHALKALKIAEEENDYSFQSRIYGFLSTQYRTIGFLDKGKESIKNGVAISFKIENKDQVTKYRAMADQEMAEYALEEQEYDRAIEYLNLAMLSYDREENKQFRDFQIGNTEEMLGRAYMGLNQKEKALEHFSKANIDINKAEAGNTLFAALIYRGLGNAFLENKILDSAEIYLKKALLISQNGKHGSLKQTVYQSVAEYYKERKQMDSFAIYDKKFNELLIENTNKKKAMVNSAYNTLKEYPKTNPENKTLYIGLAIALGLLISYVVYYKRKSIFGISKIDLSSHANKPNDLILSQKTEDELLQKLEEFEASNDFLDKNMSMSVLIGRLNTNTKYLRHILNKKKNTDYNTYINELRINYIVNKLKTNPEYLNYKISYLADESGFSSHSKFSADFKRIVHLSPSEFIESLK